MPLVFEQPNLDHADQNRIHFARATVRLARGTYNIADEPLADAIELLSRKSVANDKKEA